MSVPEKQLLKSVSRSFYLSLRALPSGLRPAMSTAYLLCRAADTVADTTLLPAERRLALISDIRSIFSVFPLPVERAKALSAMIREELSKEPSAERILVSRLDECLDALQRLSKTDQALVQRVVVAVSTGMEKDLRDFGTDAENLKALMTVQDLESYIGWIGGEPGRFWTDICVAHGVRFSDEPAAMRELGFRFGTGLQMVNILRDLHADLKLGRCYIPIDRLREHGLAPEDLRDPASDERFRGLYHELIDETVERLRAGLTYVEKLPWHAIFLRGAAWWPLVLALRTLAMLRGSKTVLEGVRAKVPRKEVYWLLLTSLAELPFNRVLRGDFDDLSDPASSASGL